MKSLPSRSSTNQTEAVFTFDAVRRITRPPSEAKKPNLPLAGVPRRAVSGQVRFLPLDEGHVQRGSASAWAEAVLRFERLLSIQGWMFE
jgi:hypothetical protein